MTQKQIDELKDKLNFKYYGDDCHIPENLKMPVSKEDEKTFNELSCREMIISCLVYGSDPFQKINKYWYNHGYCERSYMSDYEDLFGKIRVKELYEEEKKSLSKATINKDVYIDSEGCSYNSINWDK